MHGIGGSLFVEVTRLDGVEHTGADFGGNFLLETLDERYRGACHLTYRIVLVLFQLSHQHHFNLNQVRRELLVVDGVLHGCWVRWLRWLGEQCNVAPYSDRGRYEV